MNNRKETPLIYDPLIIPRVKEYLEENIHQTYVDVTVMARKLQERYKEYNRRKAGPFRMLVRQAYKLVLQSYGLGSNPSSDDNLEENSDLELMNEEDSSNNISNMIRNLYTKKTGEPESIDISSDESDENTAIPSKDKSKPGEVKRTDTTKPTEWNVTVSMAGAKVLESPPAKKRKTDPLPSTSGEESSRISQLPKYKSANDPRQPQYSDTTPATGLRSKRFKMEVQKKESNYTFGDIGGMEIVLIELCELLFHMNRPGIYTELGAIPPRGILLHGPPGCGKSLLAHAIAGQLNIGIIEVAATELIGGVSGESEERIREVFQQAVLLAPCILFIDEIDVISSSRLNAQKDMERRVVSQLISSFDNLKNAPKNDQILIVGATCQPDVLDSSLRRVGRFEHEICLKVPTKEERFKILSKITRGFSLDDSMDFTLIAELTPGFVGGDLLALSSRAASIAVKRQYLSYLTGAQNKRAKEKVGTEIAADVDRDEVAAPAEAAAVYAAPEPMQTEDPIEIQDSMEAETIEETEEPERSEQFIEIEGLEESGTSTSVKTSEHRIRIPNIFPLKIDCVPSNEKTRSCDQIMIFSKRDNQSAPTTAEYPSPNTNIDPSTSEIPSSSTDSTVSVVRDGPGHTFLKIIKGPWKLLDNLLPPFIETTPTTAVNPGVNTNSVTGTGMGINPDMSSGTSTSTGPGMSTDSLLRIGSGMSIKAGMSTGSRINTGPGKSTDLHIETAATMKIDEHTGVISIRGENMNLFSDKSSCIMAYPGVDPLPLNDSIINRPTGGDIKTYLTRVCRNRGADSLTRNMLPQPTSEAYLSDLLKWVTESELPEKTEKKKLTITLEDFITATKHVKPTAKREGFITVPNVTWSDVGALESVREELQLAIIAPIKYPQVLERLGINVPAGILLSGPPGCGKTLLAKAIANEAGVNFISVKGPELMNKYVGESEKAIRNCFQRARNSAPCVIFFDEFDSICPRRGDSMEGSGVRVINQLLTEMDGIEERKGVFILAATNRPDILDPAVLRPGRFDTLIKLGMPNHLDRVKILNAITKGGLCPPLSDDVNMEYVSSLTDGYTGADLAGVIRKASVYALKEFLRGRPSNIVRVNRKHITMAIQRTEPSVSPQDRNYYQLQHQNQIKERQL